MSQKRTKIDPGAAGGIGFVIIAGLIAFGTFAAATDLDRVMAPAECATIQSGKNAGAALVFTQAQIHAQTPGDRTTGSYTYTITRLDSGGNPLGVWATLTVVAAHTFTTVDLRDRSGNGLKLGAGEMLRLDLTGSAPTGGATTAANIKIRLIGESYGIAA